MPANCHGPLLIHFFNLQHASNALRSILFFELQWDVLNKKKTSAGLFFFFLQYQWCFSTEPCNDLTWCVMWSSIVSAGEVFSDLCRPQEYHLKCIIACRARETLQQSFMGVVCFKLKPITLWETAALVVMHRYKVYTVFMAHWYGSHLYPQCHRIVRGRGVRQFYSFPLHPQHQ